MNLVNEMGRVRLGIFKEALDAVNYEDYTQETPLGLKVPGFLKKHAPNQFHFFGLLGHSFVMGMAIVDLKYLSNVFFYAYDRDAREMKEVKKTLVGNSRVSIAPRPERPESVSRVRGLGMKLTDTRVEVLTEDMRLNLDIDISGTEPLRICTKSGYRGWTYTQKTAPLAVDGKFFLGDTEYEIKSNDYLGLYDWTCGYMRRDTYWNWAATASVLPDGRLFGMNLSQGVNETSFTENAFWVDGEMTKVDTVFFDFDYENMFDKWHITSFDGKVDLEFSPETKRSEKINAIFVASRFSQFVGKFDGRLRTASGNEIDLKGCPGYAEDHFARW